MIYNDKLEMLNFEYLKNLNEAQKEAVEHLDGPLLIVAGAGSGKTKVLTSRIANIIKEKKAFPNQILAVTFTNKAAREMQNRVSKILGSTAIGLSWLGTFHSICAKLLRKHASAANLNSNFTIIDTDDQIRLIKNICKAENIDIKQLAPRYILAIIDKWKNKGQYPNEVIINLTLNNVSKDLSLNYTTSGDSISINGELNILDFNGSKALASINKACEALHTGADGISKTWAEVNLYITSVLKETCE
mgnify:CR=1 FL=1